MRNTLILAGAVAAIISPVSAVAQPDPGCVRSNQQTSVTGTALGALGGALLGGAIAGRHDRGVGVVGGALAGGVAGNVLSGQHNDPCPDGYYRSEAPPPPPGGEYQTGFWQDAPPGIHQRIDFLYQRITSAQQGGYIAPREADRAYHDLSDVRRQAEELRSRDGGALSPPDRDYVQSRLDDISRRLNWQTRGG